MSFRPPLRNAGFFPFFLFIVSSLKIASSSSFSVSQPAFLAFLSRRSLHLHSLHGSWACNSVGSRSGSAWQRLQGSQKPPGPTCPTHCWLPSPGSQHRLKGPLNTGSRGPRPQRSEEIWGGQRALATHRAASLKGSAGLLCVFKKTREERSGTSPVVWWLRL